MTVHDLPEAMLDRLAAKCSNAGRRGSSDCMGTLSLVTAAVAGQGWPRSSRLWPNSRLTTCVGAWQGTAAEAP